MIRSHHKKQDFSLTLPILNIQVQKEKGKRCPSTVLHPIHSSSLNISNLNFPCGSITRAFNLQSTSKAHLVLKSIDQQNNPMALSFLYFDDCRALGKVTYNHMANEYDQCQTSRNFLSAVYIILLDLFFLWNFPVSAFSARFECFT